MSGDLPEIALHDLSDGGPLDLLEREQARAREILRAGRRQYSAPLIDAMNCASRHWARRVGAPYLEEVEAAARGDLPRGIWFMNFAFEWGCTSRAADDPSGGTRLLRTLDWPFHGLGRLLCVTRQQTDLGPYYNITWPGFLGIITAVAPGRFSIAINQAPVPKTGPAWLPHPWPVDWGVARVRTFASRNIVPAFLLRRVFETCRNFTEAREMLESTPTALPAFFTIAGTQPGECCVVERLPERTSTHQDRPVVANDWLSADLSGKPRGAENAERCAALAEHTLEPEPELDWVKPPVLNSHTRLALSANAATGRLLVRGYEKDGPATRVLEVSCG